MIMHWCPASRPQQQQDHQQHQQASCNVRNLSSIMADRICPHEFLCPITGVIMTDPHSCADGHSYEKEAIATWLLDHDTSPKTNLMLEHKKLTPDHSLREVILNWLEVFNGLDRDQISVGRRIETGSGLKSVFEGTYSGRRVVVLKVCRAGMSGTCLVYLHIGVFTPARRTLVG